MSTPTLNEGERTIHTLLREYIDAGIAVGREEGSADPRCIDTDPELDRAYEKCAALRTEVGLYIVRLEDALSALTRARPLDHWHEDHGSVLWWRFPVDEPPYAGQPLDSDWPGYHTHWTPIPVPRPPEKPSVAGPVPEETA